MSANANGESSRDDAIKKVGVWIVAGILIAAAAVSNPDIVRFRSWAQAEAGVLGSLSCQAVQTTNFTVFSNYEWRCPDYTGKYIGIFNNFYLTNKSEIDAQK